ncbi:MAG: DEAD/DEAH box helicase [Salinibacterium sp.]|nr:MAG: DEAD/DEAH box helicase [Salinibacterium sp.]
MRPELRPYQRNGLKELRNALLEGYRAIVVVSPCGSGKTVMFADMIDRIRLAGKKVLVLAHRKELIDQTSAKLDALEVPHGVIKAGHYRVQPWQPVQVASVQTLINRPQFPEADYVVPDESHHATSETWHTIIQAYPNARIIGWTATPYRGDGTGLAEAGFQKIVVVAQIPELIEQGYLVPAREFAPYDPDLRRIRKTAADYNSKDLGRAMDRPTLIGNLVETWKKWAPGRSTVVFAVGIEHSRHIVERFLKEGITAEHLDADTPDDQRVAILGRVASGQTTIISNVTVLTEGWDMPRLSCGIMARPTLSESLFVQMCGRPLRPNEGKVDCILLDHAGNTGRHGSITDHRPFSLLGEPRASGVPKPPSQKTCPKCLSVVPSSVEKCPGLTWDGRECLHVFEKKKRVIIESPGELREMRKASIQKMEPQRQAELLAKFILEARSLGHHPSAPYAKYRGMFGRPVDESVRESALEIVGR